MYSMVAMFTKPGGPPTPKPMQPLVELENAPHPYLASIKVPKLVAFPVVAMVMY